VSEPRSPVPRVEQALTLLPDVEALAPLRALILSASRPDERAQWSSLGPFLTVGKRAVDPTELRQRMAPILGRVQEHLSALYDAYVEALDCQRRRDGAGAVAALRQAGRLEEENDRPQQARAWFEAALVVAERLPERRPEIALLRALGGVCHGLARYEDSARYCQRSLALAEAEFDQAGAIDACEGLGVVALAQGEWAGAQPWFLRGLRLAEAGKDSTRIGQLHYRMGELQRRRGDLTAAADHLGRAKEHFEAAGDAAGLARVLDTQGQVDSHLGRLTAASGALREALAWCRRAPGQVSLEVAVRLHLAEVAVRSERYLDAEEELRRAEQAAILRNLGWRLVQVYTLMGALRGRQGEEMGFVFFEQGIELCHSYAVPPGVEAHLYHEYGAFRTRFGANDEARAYLEKAREMFRTLGEVDELERVQADLLRVSA
jgi:tetratricopeptide (TPR) repeat protein